MWLKRFCLGLVMLAGIMPSAGAQPLTKATLLLNWYLYAEHAPFFLGVERGYFRDEGIDLDIQEGRGSVPTVQAVVSRTADFGYADVASALKAADKGAPVLVTGVLLQSSPMSFIALADKNIRTPADMRGKTLALTPGDSLSQVLPLVLKKVGMSEKDFTIVAGDARTKLNAVVNGQADVMLGYSMDQNLKIEAATGKPTSTLPFSDLGVNLASSAIVVSKETAEKRADLVRGFMRAATRAAADAAKEPEAAVDAMLKTNPKSGVRDDLVRGLKLTIPLYHTKRTTGQPPFRENAADFSESVSLLGEFGGISPAMRERASDVLSLDFLPKN